MTNFEIRMSNEIRMTKSESKQPMDSTLRGNYIIQH